MFFPSATGSSESVWGLDYSANTVYERAGQQRLAKERGLHCDSPFYEGGAVQSIKHSLKGASCNAVSAAIFVASR